MSSTEIQASAAGRAAGKKPNIFARIILFIKQVFVELKKVTTPTRKELWKYFLVVLGFVVLMMLFVTVIDQLFGLATSFLFDGSSY
ncbi:preprotein translocase subunit SecE [Canibacter zhoujuaniae]|uniref:preprotein translocase subunit SecE n=1 Tax=Canibacter zhoujuaniae TaxID=2708343 RepID=UPI0014210C66|nr:preprotein translocase subunit SecE [Canibacter zhoujuaniae]